ncbi:MAG: hypothetical protein ACLFUZ_01435 [Candidatus Micrarchaeia archaeon]
MVRHKIEKKPEKRSRESFPQVPGEKKKIVPPEMQHRLNVNLLRAAKKQQWKRAGRLIDEGASPEEIDGMGYSAITYASAAGESGLVRKMLNEGGFNIDEPPNYAAILLAYREEHHEIVELLGKNMKEQRGRNEFYARALKDYTLVLIEDQEG